MRGPYDDIIHLPRHVSATHPQMPTANRAAQFSSFAALTGYEDAIQEAARLTDAHRELDEHAIAALDRKLCMLAERAAEHPDVAVTCFRPDQRKAGGAYVTVTGAVKKIDPYERALFLMDGGRIAMEDVLEIDCEIFKDLL